MKIEKTKAFTIIELMVSIFITITVIASFYKLYEASLKTERTASIRVSVNLLGEQILDTVADSMRLIGLNGEVGDLQTTDPAFGILRGTPVGGTGKSHVSFTYISPYGSPITKLQESASEGPFPACTFKLFNSAAFHKNITKLYIHNQQGVYVTKKVGAPSYSGNNAIVTSETFFNPDDDGDKWNWMTADKDKTCAQRFPAGTLVSGEDFFYSLTYTYPNTLTLAYKVLDASGNPTGAWNSVIDFEYDSDKDNETFQIPFFVLQFLKESIDGDAESRTWVSTFSTDERNDIIAVRFGFVVLSRKDRVTVKDASAAPAMSNKYCVFNDNTNNCYELTNPNYTASVFQRVVYLANFRLLKDQVKK
jgi:type II secretory pathway pseudopilin PulG